MEYRNETFGDVEVQIDGAMFINCTFNQTILKYNGGRISFSGCHLDGVEWKLGGDFLYALNTMRKFGRLGGPKGVKSMADTFASFMRQSTPGEVIALD
jgi:hypothetical protein